MTELEELSAAFDESLADLLPIAELLASARDDREVEGGIRQQVYDLSLIHISEPTRP